MIGGLPIYFCDMVKPYQYNKRKGKKSAAMKQWWALPEHTIGDVIDDVLYVNDGPVINHQTVILKLTFEIEYCNREFKLGTVYPMDTAVFIDDRNVVQPDLVFVANNNAHVNILVNGIYGAPDLILEIWSPSTKRKDCILKKDLFERIGVREYWMVDPASNDSYGFLLENGKYGEPLRLNSQIHVRLFDKTFPF